RPGPQSSDNPPPSYVVVRPEASPTVSTEEFVDPNLEEEFDEEADEEYVEDNESLVCITAAFRKDHWLPCFIHTLVLAFKKPVNDENSEVNEPKKDALRLAAHFARSAKAT